MAKPRKLSGRALRALAAVALPLIVAGCDSLPFTWNTTSTETAATPVSLPPPPPRKPAAPAFPVIARLPEPTETAPANGFDRLIGLDETHLSGVLGEPMKRAEAPPATIWRYLGQACELDVYFYFDLQSQAMRALHYEVRSHESREQPAQQCYDELVRERRAGADPAASTDRPR